ncbi:MAG: cyclic nucleotide-binding domain-containing protein [Bacteroidota bacterium]
MRKNLSRIFRINQDETWFVQSFFFHHFFQGYGLAVFFITASVIFLARFSAQNLPLVYVLSALFMLLGGQLYSNLQHIISLERLMQSIVFLIAGSVIVFLGGIGDYDFIWFVFLLVIWYRVIYLFSNFESWALAAILFQARSTKRNLSWLTIGDLPGMIVGYFSVPVLLHWIDTQQLLLLSALAFIASLFFLRRIIKKEAYTKIYEENTESRSEVLKAGPAIGRFFSNRSILVLSLLTLLVIMLTIWLDFALLNNLQHYFNTEKSLAWCLGVLFGVISLLSFVAKMIFSRRLISEIGIKRSLFVLPLIMLVLAVLLFFPSALPMFERYAYMPHFIILTLIFTSLRYALQRPVFLTLLQPLVSRFRFQGYNLMKGFVEPASVGIAGGVLLLLGKWDISLDNNLISWLINGVAFTWFINIVVYNRNYIGILKTAVDVRAIKGSELVIRDKKILEILESKLEHGQSEEVIYTMEFLQKFDMDNLHEKLHAIIKHPSEEVRIHALKKIETLELKDFEPEILAIIESENSPNVKAAAIRAICSLNHSLVGQVKQLANHEEEAICRAVLSSMYQYGTDEEKAQADQAICGFASSKLLQENQLAISIIGELQDKKYAQIIMEFLEDERGEVVKYAINAAGKLQDEAFIPKLLKMVERTTFHNEVLRTLGFYKEKSIPFLKEVFGEANSSRDFYYLRLCRLCGKIGGEKAFEVLWWVTGYEWIELQSEAFIALQTAGYKAEDRDQIYYVTDRMESLFKRLFWLYNALALLHSKPGFALLEDALDKELALRIQHVKILISFLFAKDQTKYKAIIRAMASIEKAEKLNALEVLKTMLPSSTVEKISILLSSIILSEKISHLSRFYNNSLLDEITVVLTILQGNNKRSRFTRWTQATALYSLSGSFYPSMLKAFLPYLTGDDPLLKQAAFHTIKEFCQDRLFTYEEIFADLIPDENIAKITKYMKEEDEILLEIEKIIVLKSTSIFSETPESVLSDIASILVEESISEGDVIFRKGDPGDCMYIIYEGQVKIHIGEYLLNTLINRDFFGDLGLLDSNPRSATATAEKDTLLLRLDQDAFYDLMAQRPEVARGIVHVLCNRIRAQDVLITDMRNKYQDSVGIESH